MKMKALSLGSWLGVTILFVGLSATARAERPHEHSCTCANHGVITDGVSSIPMFSTSRTARTCRQAYRLVQDAITSASAGLIFCPGSVAPSPGKAGYSCSIDCD
jgi:hypothetical protein